MKMTIIPIKTRLLIGSCLVLLATACVNQQSQQINAVAAKMSDCEKIQALIAEHQNDFEKIRFSVQNTNKMDIWRSHYHLVGNSCQVWSWGPGNSDYVCSMISPSEAIARERFEKAKKITRQCLDNSWQLTESTRKIGNGSKAVFSQKGQNTIVSTHVVETRGIFNTEWTTYYFVGDRSDQL